MLELKHQIRFYVPSTKGPLSIADNVFLKRSLFIRRIFSSLFDGATTTRAIGDYIGKEDILISEKILIVGSFADTEKIQKHYQKVFLLGSYCAKYWDQQSIGFALDNVFYMVDGRLEKVPLLSFGQRSLLRASIISLFDKAKRIGSWR